MRVFYSFPCVRNDADSQMAPALAGQFFLIGVLVDFGNRFASFDGGIMNAKIVLRGFIPLTRGLDEPFDGVGSALGGRHPPSLAPDRDHSRFRPHRATRGRPARPYAVFSEALQGT